LPSSGPHFTKQLQRLLRDVAVAPYPIAQLWRDVTGVGWALGQDDRYAQIREAIIRTQLADLLPGERFGFCVSLAAAMHEIEGRDVDLFELWKPKLTGRWHAYFWDVLHPLCPPRLSAEDLSELNLCQPGRLPYWVGPFSFSRDKGEGWLWLRHPRSANDMQNKWLCPR
jgi:hypothetical protein